jgi:hypothetical protein
MTKAHATTPGQGNASETSVLGGALEGLQGCIARLGWP